MLPVTLMATASRAPSSCPSEKDVTFHAETATGVDPLVRMDTLTRRRAPSAVTGGSPSLSVLERILDSTPIRQSLLMRSSSPTEAEDDPFGSSKWHDRHGLRAMRVAAHTFQSEPARYSVPTHPTAPFDPPEKPGAPPPEGAQ